MSGNNAGMTPPIATTAIILAAGELPEAMQAAFGRTSPAMLPVNGRPIIHWSLSYLRGIGMRRVILVVRKAEHRLKRFVMHCFGSVMEIVFAEPAEDRGPGGSLACGLEHVASREAVLVVLGDTLFSLPPLGERAAGSFVLTSPVADASRWCLAGEDDTGLVTSLADKPAQNPGVPGKEWPALVGVYHLADPEPAREALARGLSEPGTSVQLRHALAPYIAAGQLHALQAAEWFDCGHADFLSHSRRRLLKSRDFNTLQIDDLRGTITKRSTHTEKFLGEINYYRLLPPDLAAFFPRLLGFSILPSNAHITLEYYGYPTLSEMWVFEEFDAAFWRHVFTRLARVAECFSAYRFTLSENTVFRFYWGKTADRLEAFAAQSPVFAVVAGAPELVLNGRPLRGWPVLRDRAEEAVRQLSRTATGGIIHGDLCFPNILFDPVAHIFKFIDPRGSFGEAGLFGDMRYDLAKLLHSIDGGYDFLIHDMFTVRAEGNRVDLQQFFPESRDAVLAAFEQTLAGPGGMRDLRLIEALLFLSMCPLHGDAPHRQTAMFAIGLRLLNEALGE